MTNINIQFTLKTHPSTKLTLPSQSEIGSNEDPFQFDDHDSFKTTDSFEETTRPSFFRIRKAQSIQNDNKTLSCLYKTIRQKQSIINKLQIKIQLLTEENNYLKQNQKSNEKENKRLDKQNPMSQQLDAKIRYLEVVLKEKEQNLQEQFQKSQHQLNLLYESLGGRLKNKEIECYLISKNLKQQKARTQQYLQEIQILKLQADKNKQIINFFYQEKQKLLAQRQKLKQQINKSQVLIMRLDYCESKISHLSSLDLNNKKVISFLQSDLETVKKQKIDLQNRLRSSTKRGAQRSDLVQKILDLQKLLEYQRTITDTQNNQLQNRVLISETMLEELNEQVFRSKLSSLNMSFKHKGF